MDTLPLDYLDWLLSQEWLKKRMQIEIENIIEKRKIKPDPIFSEIIKNGYRELVKLHHPDVGGDTIQMTKINEAYENLKKLLGIQ